MILKWRYCPIRSVLEDVDLDWIHSIIFKVIKNQHFHDIKIKLFFKEKIKKLQNNRGDAFISFFNPVDEVFRNDVWNMILCVKVNNVILVNVFFCHL